MVVVHLSLKWRQFFSCFEFLINSPSTSKSATVVNNVDQLKVTPISWTIRHKSKPKKAESWNYHFKSIFSPLLNPQFCLQVSMTHKCFLFKAKKVLNKRETVLSTLKAKSHHSNSKSATKSCSGS